MPNKGPMESDTVAQDPTRFVRPGTNYASQKQPYIPGSPDYSTQRMVYELQNYENSPWSPWRQLFMSRGCRAAQHSTAQHSTAQHSTAQHSTAQHSMLVLQTWVFLWCTSQSAPPTITPSVANNVGNHLPLRWGGTDPSPQRQQLYQTKEQEFC